MNRYFSKLNGDVKRWFVKVSLICMALSMSTISHAELTVIYDSGKTKPTGIFLKDHRIQLKEIPKTINLANMLTTQYPVTSTKTTVGRVDSKKVTLPPGFQPLFIVGNDQWSLQWLQMHQDHLLDLHAVGILAEAKSETDLKNLQKQFPGLVLMPMSVDAIAERLAIQHYPVLITRDRIEQ